MGSSITRATRWGLTIVTLLLLMAWALPVLAEGDGSGGGQGVPLGLASSSPADGAQNVALDTQIKLVFNKNVVNMTVKENNLSCFTLYAGNAVVPAEVRLPDDQIYPELKREVILAPRSGLQAGTDYTVVIAKSLQAKNGTVLGQDVKIRFSTAAAQAALPPVAATEEKTAVNSPAAQKQESVAPTGGKAAAESGGKPGTLENREPELKADSSDKSQPQPIDKQTLPAAQKSKAWYDNSWISGALVIIVMALVAYRYLKKRR